MSDYEKKKAPPPNVAGRLPPANVDLERATLATTIVDRIALTKVRSLLKAEHFFDPQHQLIHEAQLAVLDAGHPVDLNTVKAQLAATGKLERAGGALYLSDLTSVYARVDNIVAYAERLVKLWEHRSFNEWLLVAHAESFDVPNFDDYRAAKARELLSKTYGVMGSGQLHLIGASVVESMQEAKDRAKGTAVSRVTPTGFTGLDEMTSGGIHDGDLWVIAGATGQGKTSLALGIAASVSAPIQEEWPIEVPILGVVLFELEMPEIQISDRMICMDAHIPFQRWRSGKMDELEWTPAGLSAEKIRASTFWVDDTADQTIEEMEGKIRALKAEWDKPAIFAPCPQCRATPFERHAEIGRWFCPVCHPDPRSAHAVTFEKREQLTREQRIALAMFDHMGKVKTDRKMPREEQIDLLVGTTKNMAKRLAMGVIDLNQFSREVDRREAKDKKPRLSDLKGSGGIEQNADVIVFPYRHGYYKPDDYKIRNEAEFIIGKARNGPTGSIPMRYIPEWSSFEDVPRDTYPEGL